MGTASDGAWYRDGSRKVLESKVELVQAVLDYYLGPEFPIEARNLATEVIRSHVATLSQTIGSMELAVLRARPKK